MTELSAIPTFVGMQKLAKLASLRSDDPVPRLTAAPPTFSVASSATISGALEVPGGGRIGYVGSTLTQSGTYPGFYSGARSGGKFRVKAGVISEAELLVKKLQLGTFALISDGELLYAGSHGEAIAGVIENGSQYVKMNWGANATVQKLVRVAIVAAGTGYAVGDTITLTGGTGTAAVLRVTSVSSGAVNGYEPANRGAYTYTGVIGSGGSSGVPTGTIATTTSGAGTGFTCTGQWQWEHTTAKPRTLEVVAGGGCYVGGLVTSNRQSLVAWNPTPSSPRLVIPGDSFTDQAFADNPAMTWAWQAAYKLGLEDNFVPMGISGAGWTATFGQLSLLDRVPEIVAANPDVIIIPLGANDEDSGVDGATIQAAVTAAIDALHAALPRVLIIAQSGWYGGYNAYHLPVVAGAAAAADQRRVRSINLFAREIYTKEIAVDHALGRADWVNVMVGATKNNHPGQNGHNHLAEVLAPIYAELISEMALDVLSAP